MGRATVELFLSQGFRVGFCDLNREGGPNIAQPYDGDRLLFIPGDVTSESDMLSVQDQVKSKFQRLDVLVHCAGIFVNGKTLDKETGQPHDLDKFRRVMHVNVVGTFNVCRLAAAVMAENEPDADGQRGLIVNTGSVTAYEPHTDFLAYSCSKAAVNGMTLHLAKDLSAFGIRVMTIAPGIFDTPMHFRDGDLGESIKRNILLPKRQGKPAEFAELVFAIVQNRMLNGSVIRLDGGFRWGVRE